MSENQQPLAARPFADLVKPLPDGSIPAVEVAKIDYPIYNTTRATLHSAGVIALWEQPENGPEYTYHYLRDVHLEMGKISLRAGDYLRSTGFLPAASPSLSVGVGEASPALTEKELIEILATHERDESAIYKRATDFAAAKLINSVIASIRNDVAAALRGRSASQGGGGELGADDKFWQQEYQKENKELFEIRKLILEHDPELYYKEISVLDAIRALLRLYKTFNPQVAASTNYVAEVLIRHIEDASKDADKWLDLLPEAGVIAAALAGRSASVQGEDAGKTEQVKPRLTKEQKAYRKQQKRTYTWKRKNKTNRQRAAAIMTHTYARRADFANWKEELIKPAGHDWQHNMKKPTVGKKWLRIQIEKVRALRLPAPTTTTEQEGETTPQ